MIKKGALYKIESNFRSKAGTSFMATEIRSGSAFSEVNGIEYGVKYTSKHLLYEDGLAVLGEITKHPRHSKYDICQLLFNNKNGIRYIYRNQFELAEKVSE